MSIIHKYLVREILKFFCIVLAVVVVLVLSVDFFGKINGFLEADLPALTVVIFFILRIPFFAAQIIPVSILMAVLVVFGLMNRNNEIVALKSSGISVYYLVRPVLAVGVLLSICLFLFIEIVVPETSSRASRIQLSRKERVVTTDEKDIWIRGKGLITHIRHYIPNKQTVFGITRIYFDEDFRMVRSIDAKKGVFRDDKWVLYDMIEQTMNEATGDYSAPFFEEMTAQLDFLPEDLKKAIKKPEEMSIRELYEYKKRIESEGFDSTICNVDLNAKIAFPLVCVIMCLAGTGIAVRGRGQRGHKGLPAFIAYGIGIVFLYWIFYSFCLSLGYGEMLPPIIAVWSPNIVFLCAGIVMLMNAE